MNGIVELYDPMDIDVYIYIKKVRDLSENDKKKIFDMYVKCYTQQIWHNEMNELFLKYPYIVSFDNYLEAYALFEINSKYNKISVLCHDDTVEGKKIFLELLYYLITQPGWVIEAFGEPSWILRKEKNTPYISEKAQIEEALDIAGDKYNRIEINNNFDYNSKYSQHYVRIYYDKKNDKEYRSEETLYGLINQSD